MLAYLPAQHGALDFRRHAAVLEAEVMHVLRRCPYVLRSFEHAAVDGALDCGDPGSASSNRTSFADRHFLLDDELRINRKPRLLLWDVKSTVARDDTWQAFRTSDHQLSCVAFFICSYSADPGFVDLIPNVWQCRDEKEWPSSAQRGGLRFTSTHTQGIDANSYRLDPARACYRMPITMLPEAMMQIREMATTLDAKFTNPHTRVEYTGWRPTMSSQSSWLKPHVDSEHFSSYLLIKHIWRMAKTSSASIELDFIDVQPQLGDFKFIIPALIRHQQGRQVVVQHKSDTKWRPQDRPLSHFDIATERRKGHVRFFQAPPTFDFLWYEFRLGSGLDQHPEFFFLPECLLPHSFYTTNARTADFDIPQFRPFRIRIDNDAMAKIVEIIRRFPSPRSPFRPEPDVVDEVEIVDAATNHEHPTTKSAKHSPRLMSPPQHKHKTAARRIFFQQLLAECALRGSGLPLCLSTASSAADLAFCRYAWSQADTDAYYASSLQTPPATITDLNPHVEVVPLSFISKEADIGWMGPVMTPFMFKHMDASAQDRLFVIDQWNKSDRVNFRQVSSYLLVPSEDIAPTAVQADHLLSVQDREERTFDPKYPSLYSLLNSGLFPSEYSLAPRGPLMFEKSYAHLEATWELLCRILVKDTFYHPKSMQRESIKYRVPVQRLLQLAYLEERAREMDYAGQHSDQSAV